MKRYAFALLALLLAVPVTAQVVQVPVVSVPPPTLVGNATVTGSFSLASPAAGTLIIQRTTVTCTIATDTNCAGKGTATIAITNAIPAGSLVLGVDARVTTVLAGSDGLATFDIGHAGDTDAWGAAIVVAATTTTGIANFTVSSPAYVTSATSVTLTGTAAKVIDSGVIKVTVYYVRFTPIAS